MEMKEIDIILIELHRLLTEVKDEGGSDELRSEIQELFARAIPLLMEIDDLDEMDRIPVLSKLVEDSEITYWNY